MQEKLKVTKKHANYYYLMSKDMTKIKNEYEFVNAQRERFVKLHSRLNTCLDVWIWNKYELNKILDLVVVNRCNNRFCPNCSSMTTAKALHNLRQPFQFMLEKGYTPFFLTLTVPNVPASQLKSEIKKMRDALVKMWRWLEQPKEKGYRGFKGRIFDFKGAISALEVNVQKTDWNMYHPHFHLLVFIENFCEEDFDQYILGPTRRKSNGDNIFYSNADIHMMQLWHMAYNGVKLTEKAFLNYSDWWGDLYQCNIVPFKDEKGLYEVFKYTFKDTDIHNLSNFKTIFMALDGKRIRQGHGELYNLKLEEECGEVQELDLDIKESPQQLITREIHTLLTVYQDYNKISRFKTHENLNEIAWR